MLKIDKKKMLEKAKVENGKSQCNLQTRSHPPTENNCSPANYIFSSCIMIPINKLPQPNSAMAQLIPALHPSESRLHEVGKTFAVKTP